MAVSINLGSLRRGFRTLLKGLGVDIRQALRAVLIIGTTDCFQN